MGTDALRRLWTTVGKAILVVGAVICVVGIGGLANRYSDGRLPAPPVLAYLGLPETVPAHLLVVLLGLAVGIFGVELGKRYGDRTAFETDE